jgi:hypothetical protein
VRGVNRVVVGELKEERLGADWRIILNWILKICGGKMWTGFRIGASGRIL